MKASAAKTLVKVTLIVIGAVVVSLSRSVGPHRPGPLDVAAAGGAVARGDRVVPFLPPESRAESSARQLSGRPVQAAGSEVRDESYVVGVD